VVGWINNRRAPETLWGVGDRYTDLVAVCACRGSGRGRGYAMGPLHYACCLH
jgi:hypothetical protein